MRCEASLLVLAEILPAASRTALSLMPRPYFVSLRMIASIHIRPFPSALSRISPYFLVPALSPISRPQPEVISRYATGDLNRWTTDRKVHSSGINRHPNPYSPAPRLTPLTSRKCFTGHNVSRKELQRAPSSPRLRSSLAATSLQVLE